MGNPFKLSAIGANDYGFLNRSKGINSFPATFTNPLKKTATPGLEQRIASNEMELPPAYLATATSGETYTVGRGHSNFGAFKPYLA